MKVGIWFYGLGTILTGVLNLVWGDFDIAHQPFKALGLSGPVAHVLAYVAGVWLIAAGVAILMRRGEKYGAVASAVAYGVFAAAWLGRYYTGVHTRGWRVDVLFGVTFGIAQQIMLIAPGVAVYVSSSAGDYRRRKRAMVAVRWMLGVPPVIFGLFHFIGLRVFASIVPHWMGFGYFWAALTGAAFFLAGCAICSGVMDLLAARMLALMLLLFEGFVEIPPIFVRLHDLRTWGAAVFNITAIGACWIFAEYVARRRERTQSSD